MLRLSRNSQAQTRKALYIKVMFSNDIKLMSFLLAALTVLRTVYHNFIVYTECKTPSDKKLEFFLNLLHVNVTYHVYLNV